MSIDWISRARTATPQIRNFIDGRQSSASCDASLEKYSPRDGALLCRYGAGQPNDVNEAVISARRAFEDGRWSMLPAQQRKQALLNLAALIKQNADEFALLECLDVGKPISDAQRIDVPAAAAIIRFNAEAIDKHYGKVYGADSSSLSYQLLRPMGVVAGIIGWNFPLILAASKIGPALAAGNSLILKPSELTSFSAARVAELAIEAGIPEGVFNVIHGDARVGTSLALHLDIDLITFTGSTQTGKKLLMASGQSNMKRLILECGGKAPNIVFDDSPDLQAVADAIIARAFWNQGQVCTASSRLLVQEGIKDKLIPLLIDRVAALTPGDPLKVDTTFGPLVSLAHKQKVQRYIESGKADGATIVYQGESPPPNETGFYVSPVIFDNVSPKQQLAQEEIFGPVLSVITFRDEAEAINIANDTIYGLSAIVWTQDLRRAHRVTLGIKAGWIAVNATEKPTSGLSEGVLSVGGHKESGIGIEGGLDGLEAYTSKTAVQLHV